MALSASTPYIAPGKVRVRWVPGHLNVPGNEPDKAAKEGAALPTRQHNLYSSFEKGCENNRQVGSYPLVVRNSTRKLQRAGS
jgi:hypothetical protein